MSSWPQIVLTVSAAEAAALEAALFKAGALSVIYHDEHDQPILEPEPGEMRLWDKIRLIGLFTTDSNPENIAQACTEAYSKPLPVYEWQALEDRDWERSWMDDFAPMQFSANLWVCPSHSQPPDPDAVNVWLDPGLAFGTGTHATTAQCLTWLGTHDLAGKRVIDFGCGSGILAVAAVLLGASDVIAVDIDPQAIESTIENAKRNGVGDRVKTGFPDQLPSLSGGQCVDLVMANILFGPLCELSGELSALCASPTEDDSSADLQHPVSPVTSDATVPEKWRGSRLVMSGVLESQVDALMLHYTQWFSFTTPMTQDGWALLEAVRRGA